MRTVLVGILLVLACRVAAAGEDAITLTVEDMPLAAVCRVIAKKTGWTVIVSRDFRERRVSTSLEATPARKALDLVAAGARLKAEPLAKDAYWVGPKLEDWEKKVHAALLSTLANAEFDGVALPDCLSFLGTLSGVSMMVDPEVRRTRKRSELQLGLSIQGVPVRTLLMLATESLALDFDVRWGGVLVSTKKRLDALPRYGLEPLPAGLVAKADAALRKRLGEERVSFDFAETPVADALEFIKTVRGMDIVIDRNALDAAEAASVTLKLIDVSVRNALDAILVPCGFRYRIEAKGEGAQILVVKAN